MDRNFSESNVTAEALVRQVYLQRFTWFYELDQTHLTAINKDLGQVLSLMNPRHTPQTCSVLDSVIAMRDMFRRIERVRNEAEEKLERYDNSTLSASLASIEAYARGPPAFQWLSGYVRIYAADPDVVHA